MKLVIGSLVVIIFIFLIWISIKNLTEDEKAQFKKQLKDPFYILSTGLLHIGGFFIFINLFFSFDLIRNIGVFAVCTSLFFIGVIHTEKSKVDGYSLILFSIVLSFAYYYLIS